MHLGAIVAMVIIGKSASVAFFCKCSLLLFESMQCSVKLHWKMHFVQLLPIVFAAAPEAQQCAVHIVHGTWSAASALAAKPPMMLRHNEGDDAHCTLCSLQDEMLELYCVGTNIQSIVSAHTQTGIARIMIRSSKYSVSGNTRRSGTHKYGYGQRDRSGRCQQTVAP